MDLKQLVRQADELDKQGKHKEADLLDRQIKREALLVRARVDPPGSYYPQKKETLDQWSKRTGNPIGRKEIPMERGGGTLVYVTMDDPSSQSYRDLWWLADHHVVSVSSLSVYLAPDKI